MTEDRRASERGQRKGPAHLDRTGRGHRRRGARRPADSRLAIAPLARMATAVVLGCQIAAVLLVGTYARRGPRLWGVPFFYWYSLLWLLIGAVGMAGCVWLLSRAEATRSGASGDDGRRA
ncbi:DUF3311 domain-containing protein [Frankia sp. AgB32]|uniref:DUF3311 domain-containing protein n=1 Tax=Frankia sp. AgB32 TaxID=631119 RepID=UPI00200FD556|nr:DUF3311 domain-containing protein [Frankia sp. AgB32]MCK9896714.1 DUF3311 domain-containing protein [Frankia sp. AgB32]